MSDCIASIHAVPLYFCFALTVPTARGHQLCVPDAGVQGHRRGDAASCLWRLQRVYIRIRPDRSRQKLHHDGPTGTRPAGNHTSGKREYGSDRLFVNVPARKSKCIWWRHKMTFTSLFSRCARTSSPRSATAIMTTACPTLWRWANLCVRGSEAPSFFLLFHQDHVW